MNKAINEIIKEADSKNLEDLISNAEKCLKSKSNLFFAELFARNALKLPEDCDCPDYPLDILDRIGCLYYGKNKSSIDNNLIHPDDIDINKLKDRLDAVKEHKIIYDVLNHAIKRDGREIVDAINKAFLSTDNSAIALVKTMGEKYIDPEYRDILKALNERIKKGGILDYIKAINKNILRRVLNTNEVEIIKNNFTIDKTEFVLKFIASKGCAYCKSSIIDLMKFYEIKNPRRGRGLSWEIDRKDPSRFYEESNYEFVCYYCNNAKSDVFTEKEFRRTVGPAIGRAINDALKRS